LSELELSFDEAIISTFIIATTHTNNDLDNINWSSIEKQKDTFYRVLQESLVTMKKNTLKVALRPSKQTQAKYI
jgi:hypothetical protein